MNISLKLCPFCGAMPEIEDDVYFDISCSNTNCCIGLNRYKTKELAIQAWNKRPLDESVDTANQELRKKIHQYGCTVASIYSLVKPLSETNGVCGAIAEAIETYTPKAVENSKIKDIEND